MRGKQLTLEEVLNLEDGSKVWVKDTDERDEQIGIVHQEGETRVFVDDDCGWFDIKYLLEYNGKEYVFFYEWIEESEIPYPSSMQQTIKNLAQEICNLRGLDLTDDNIRLIVEEFKEVK